VPAPARRPAFQLPAAAALVALIAIVAVVLVIRAGNPARTPAPDAAAPVLSAAQTGDEKRPSPKTAASSARAREDEPARAVENTKGPFTIEVGGYLDLQTAIDERDRMQLLTGFEGWVIPADDGQKHRVVVGAYRNRTRAQNAANMLLRSRTLPRATVVPLPPREQRL
jgi:cell division protein FtsN